MGDNRNAPPRATPPNADFLKNERRLFSSSAGILGGCGCSIVAGSFSPNFFNNFCDGVMVVSIYETRLFDCGLRIADCGFWIADFGWRSSDSYRDERRLVYELFISPGAPLHIFI